MFTIHKILVPTDFSEQGALAFDVACSLAKQHNAEVTVLHVLTPPVSWGEMIPRQWPDDYEQSVRDEFLLPMRSPYPGVRVEHQLETGRPDELIVSVAEDRGCDLIVMGTHGRSGLSRLVMGSVAEQVTREAPCPVLAVRVPPANPEQAPEPMKAVAVPVS